MQKQSTKDLEFETGFFESVLKRDKDYVEVIELLGSLYTKLGRIEDGLKMDRRMVKLRPSNATAHYNLACSLALLKRHDEALETLRTAIKLGYDDADFMAKDADLDSLKENEEFQKLLAEIS